MKAISILSDPTPLTAGTLASYLKRSINFLISIGFSNPDVERVFRRDLFSLNQLTLLDISTSINDDYLLESIYEVLAVEELLNKLFSGSPTYWLSEPHVAFGYASPKEMLPSAGLAGISLIRILLEQELHSIRQ